MLRASRRPGRNVEPVVLTTKWPPPHEVEMSHAPLIQLIRAEMQRSQDGNIRSRSISSSEVATRTAAIPA